MATKRAKCPVRPTPAVAGTTAYHVPRAATPVDLFLDGNEGAVPPSSVLDTLPPLMPDVVRRYPNRAALEALLGERLGLAPAQVIVTSGGDDALDRICRSVLTRGRELILPEPSFEMINRYCRLSGGTLVSVPWPDGPYPLAGVLQALTPKTAAVAVVTPNNPTGCLASAEDLRRLAEAAPHALLIVDLAYVEFADADLTQVALALPNAVVVRTLSKAWGLAGLRVGYALGPPEIIGWLRAAGGPYAVSGPSLALAAARLRDGDEAMRAFVAEIRRERQVLTGLLRDWGARPAPSEANFIFARFRDAAWVRDALAGFGIAVRHFPDRPALVDGLRITLPGEPAAFDRLVHALHTVLAPQAVLFDMDGVLADEGDAYLEAIVVVAARLGVTLDPAAVQQHRAANPTLARLETVQALLAEAGRPVTFEQAFNAFAAIYFQDAGPLGWNGPNPVLVPADWLRQLGGRVRIGIVTSRFRGEIRRFLTRAGYDDVAPVIVCADDVQRVKPAPDALLRAMQQLGVQRAWMLGDAGADMRAARAAGALPLGVLGPRVDVDAATTRLTAAGAGRVLPRAQAVEELLP
jgi:histidinol-phosphate aminotransferase